MRFVGLTGSSEVGEILYRQACIGLKKLGLELAPFMVFDDPISMRAIEDAIVSKHRNLGETCVCANRLYAQSRSSVFAGAVWT